MLTFAEQEIVLPDGPMQGLLFKRERQPWVAHWLAACSCPLWISLALVGPVQSGKTLNGYVVPMTWHLFENQETVVCGLPDMNMGGDKWREDIKPVISAGRYKAMLPDSGAGSRDAAKVESVKFKNNRTLKFMSGGGKDQRRSAFTTRVVLVTEADGLDEAGTASRESSKLKQIEGRTKSFGDRARVYLECTASIREGAIWQAWTNGTGSMMAVPCGACGFYVIPERDSLVGWQDATSKMEARSNAKWKCPRCAATWEESQRREMNNRAVLVHGIAQRWENDNDDNPWQHVPAIAPEELDVYTELPEGQTAFSMRYNAFNNMFTTAGQLAEGEWTSKRSANTDDSDKQIRQQNWALPARATKEQAVNITIETIKERQHGTGRGVVPKGAAHVVASMDIGKFKCHWIVMGWTDSCRGYVIDYGVKEVSQSIALESAIEIAIREQWDEFQEGYRQDGGTELRRVDRMIVDSGYMPDAAYRVAFSLRGRVLASKGYGESQRMKNGKYVEPKGTSKEVAKGLQYHIVAKATDCGQVALLHANVDFWKTFAHRRLACGIDEDSAVTLFSASGNDHIEYARHMTAEQLITETGAGGRETQRWEVIRKMNHWLDCYTMNCYGAHTVGVRYQSSETKSE